LWPLYCESLDATHGSSEAPLTLAAAAAAIGLPQQRQPIRRTSCVDAQLPSNATTDDNKSKNISHGISPAVTMGDAPTSIHPFVEFEPMVWQKEQKCNQLHVAMSMKAASWKVKQLLECKPGLAME
jgi:hypothetical protein